MIRRLLGGRDALPPNARTTDRAPLPAPVGLLALLSAGLVALPAPAQAAPVQAAPVQAAPVQVASPTAVRLLVGRAELPSYRTRADVVVAALARPGTADPVVGELVTLYAQGAGDPARVVVAEGRTDVQGLAVLTLPPRAERTELTVVHTASAAAEAVTGGLTVYPQAPGPPSSPLSVSVRAGDGEALVSFSTPVSDGGAAVTGYDVVLRAYGHATRTASSAAAGQVLVDGLDDGTRYEVAVSARNDVRGGLPSVTGVVPERGASTDRRTRPGTQVCGALPVGVTRWDATGAPYQVCDGGVLAPTGSVLVLDGGAGGFDVSAPGSGLGLIGGSVRTEGTATDRRVRVLGSADSQGSGLFVAGSSRDPSIKLPSAVDLRSVDVEDVDSGLRVGRTLRLRLADVAVLRVRATG